MSSQKIEKASLGSEDGFSCDRCGAVVDKDEVRSIYIGDKGQKVDYCGQCFEREVVRRRD